MPGLEPQAKLDRYIIAERIGAGGMGEVYRAHDPHLQRDVAVKVVRAHESIERDEAVQRLLREARAAASLAHPHIVTVHDLGESADGIFVVMELVRGRPLTAYVGDESVPLARRLGWLADIARALGAAHDAGIVHRDIKPPNVMITASGTPKVLDFGLARPVEPGMGFRTELGWVLGTPRYMAPEQLAGAEADARADQYSFGVMACELLAGARLSSPVAAAEEARRALVAHTSEAVATAIARTLAYERGDRFGAIVDVAEVLEAAARAEAVAASPRAAAPADEGPTERVEAGEPPGVGALRTQLANEAHDVAATVERAFRGTPVEEAGWTVRLSTPQGPSTSGTWDAVQPLVARSRGSAGSVVVGHVDTQSRTARLRSYGEVVQRHRERGRTAPPERTYAQILAVATVALRASRFEVSVLPAASARRPHGGRRLWLVLPILAALLLVALLVLLLQR